MRRPICEYIEKYASNDNIRLHMPGHKGIGGLSERFDITEIDGADSLYEASGIIKESEEIASGLFGSYTLYSTEGSSLAIRAMLYLSTLTDSSSKGSLILAGRNAHKVFISASILLGFDVEWLSSSESSYLCCRVSPEDVASKLDSMERKPLAVYITSPDYLGNMADIKGIADVCHKRGVLLLVDNAHGAYLAFTKPSIHPIALGADMCADSAHKTLPCLTGAAYLHIAKSIPKDVRSRAKSALALFGSTSPSYLILASLDKANSYLNDGYADKLSEFCAKLSDLRTRLEKIGYDTVGNEPMKLTLAPKSYGYTGHELGKILLGKNIVPEFYDADYLVLMPTPEIDSSCLNRLYEVLSSVQKKDCISELPPDFVLPEAVMTPREAALSPAEAVDVDASLGRVLADITVGCPPAVPIVVSGEKINEDAIRAFSYYGIKQCTVVKPNK